MKKSFNASDLKKLIEERIKWDYGKTSEKVAHRQIYKSTCRVVRDIMADTYAINSEKEKNGDKQVYYMSMEFLPGASLHNNAFNLGLEKSLREAVFQLGFDLEDLYSMEPDAGLGNGGLGRLASCYLDASSTLGIKCHGMSICYDYGIFRQKIENNQQKEAPDLWMDLGDCWLLKNKEEAETVTIGGKEVIAVPHDMFISGYDSSTVNSLRLWEATSSSVIDMDLFSQGKYLESMEERHQIEVISKILYPEDAHKEGKILRISQQYFFVSASMQSMVKKHFAQYASLHNLADKVAVHINDTHPSLVIPELMRILMDEYDMDWDYAWEIVTRTVSYTNHTVMPEALEKWKVNLLGSILPRISEIIQGINDRFSRTIHKLEKMEEASSEDLYIIKNDQIHMANMCVLAAHKVNGVSSLHSQIIKGDLFPGFAKIYPNKFTNVTNGIAYRRWLCQANPALCGMIEDLIGQGFKKDAQELEGLLKYKGDSTVLTTLAEIKKGNKLRLIEYIKDHNNINVDHNTIFDVQAKRLHEYKRQLLNVLHIIDLYLRIKDNPGEDIEPRTFIFAAKAASGYYLAKEIISLICNLSEFFEKDPQIRDRLKVVFLENYSVAISEILMPAAEVSEQISLAGKEASGTGNMKLMINGALTLGTLDGANVEIRDQVGEDNMFLFGMTTEEVVELRKSGAYNPISSFIDHQDLARVLERISSGINKVAFPDIINTLTTGYNGPPDEYFLTKDFHDYKRAQQDIQEAYRNPRLWNEMSLINIAKAGLFSADRAVTTYADEIWFR
jgi:starch phosphorylase